MACETDETLNIDELEWHMYEIEYNGSLSEEVTEAAALHGAKRLIDQDIGPVTDWAVAHDQVINVWFVQAEVDGTPVGSTATITGPEQAVSNATSDYPPHIPAVPLGNRLTAEPRRRREDDSWLRCATFTGSSPANAFYDAYAWIAAQQHTIVISDVGWSVAPASHRFNIKVYYLYHGR